MLVAPYSQPWANNYQRQADDAFWTAESATANELRALRPPLPQIVYLPPRFGYATYDERQPTVLQVFGMDRVQPSYLPQTPLKKPGDGFEDTRFQGSDRLTNGGDPLGLGGGGN